MDANSIMKYKGYSALIRYSSEDGCLIGRVLGIADIISFEGDSVERMREEFETALDDYLAFCKERGKEAERPYSGRIIVRMPSALHRRVAIAAESRGDSINDAINAALEAMYGKEEDKVDKKKSAVKPRRRRKVATAV